MDGVLKTADELEEMVGHWRPALLGWPASAVSAKASEEQWSIREIIGHLVDSAGNNIQRFVRLQCAKELDFPDYTSDNEAWVAIQGYRDEDWARLVDLWAGLNLHIAHLLRRVRPHTLNHVWNNGPESPVTLRELIPAYVSHQKMHLEQAAERMAGR
ncbi:MAG: DinB family protein [bacterium]|nr:DinB family protein [bacterium]